MTIDINGDVIDEITIDGEFTEEVTVDGDVVFKRIEPVAYNNLVAWYPFENFAQDATANDQNSGDSSDYSGNVIGASYSSTGGVTDIKSGSNSGVYSFGEDGDRINLGLDSSLHTVSMWVNPNDNYTGDDNLDCILTGQSRDFIFGLGDFTSKEDGETIGFYESYSGNANFALWNSNLNSNEWVHFALVYDTSKAFNYRLYLNGNEIEPFYIKDSTPQINVNYRLGTRNSISDHFGGKLDDIRFYNKSLSSFEISTIYNNTKP